MIAVSASATCRRFTATRRWAYMTPLYLVAVMVIMLVGCAGSEPRKRRIWADQVVIEKSKRRLTLIQDGKVLRKYRIALGERPRGYKVRQGDARSPCLQTR